jgi:hypothetical protein
MSMGRREARAARTAKILKATLPSRMMLAARREMFAAHRLAIDETAPAAVRLTAMQAGVKLRDQLLDLLGVPKRPAAPPAKSGMTIPVHGEILDALVHPPNPQS